MGIGEGLTLAAKGLIGPGVRFVLKRWRHWRYGVHLTARMDWCTPQVLFSGQPSTYWRGVFLDIVASKDEEFVVAEGDIDVRTWNGWRWKRLPAAGALFGTITVERNRKRFLQLNGRSLAKLLRGAYPTEKVLEIRATVRDHHRVKAVSEPLSVTIADLEQEDYR